MLRVSHKTGLDANLPLFPDGRPTPTVADPGIIAATGAGWVRLNFVLGPWAAPGDPTLYQGRDWAGAYRALIDGFRARGLDVYGLAGHEAVHTDPGDLFRSSRQGLAPAAEAAALQWIQDYTANFVWIVRQFVDQVSVFESFNEPDDWHGSNRNWVHPTWFAAILQQIYVAVQADPAIRHVRLVSGPLQGLQINGNAAADYLRQTYREGRARFGWGQGASFPFDGIGYHLYIREAYNADWAAQQQAVHDMYYAYTNAMRAVIRDAEGWDKPLYVSEMGWHSNGGLEQFQAANLPLGLGLVTDDPGVRLGVWFCTQDFGGPADGKFYGLYRVGDLTPGNRKPSYDAYQAFCAQPLPASVGLFTNQSMINAVYFTAQDLGEEGWPLLTRAGLSGLVFARDAAYAGLPVETLPNLTDAERADLRRRISEWAIDAGRRVGLTTTTLNLRGGPGTENPVLQQLAPQERVEVLDEQGDWLHVVAAGRLGYVNRYYVRFPARTVSGFLRQRPATSGAPLAPPDTNQLVATGSAAPLVATWNRIGGLLAVLSTELDFDPALAVAVFVTESGGRAFGDDGRMIIRFENHIFYDEWGQRNPAQYARFFRFDAAKRWQGHQWRPAANAPWRSFHGDQAAEWQVLQFALTLDDSAARRSTSMGGPQIMGFNYPSMGFESVQEMFDTFAAGERQQIVGFFDFLLGLSRPSPKIDALQRKDFNGFATLYNGSGQVAQYGSLIADGYHALQDLL